MATKDNVLSIDVEALLQKADTIIEQASHSYVNDGKAIATTKAITKAVEFLANYCETEVVTGAHEWSEQATDIIKQLTPEPVQTWSRDDVSLLIQQLSLCALMLPKGDVADHVAETVASLQAIGKSKGNGNRRPRGSVPGIEGRPARVYVAYEGVTGNRTPYRRGDVDVSADQLRMLVRSQCKLANAEYFEAYNEAIDQIVTAEPGTVITVGPVTFQASGS